MKDNPFLTKRGLSIIALFIISFFCFSFITDTLDIYAPGRGEDGETINLFDMTNFFPAIAICYLLEGVFAVVLGEEPPEYRKRRYKKEALYFIGLYFMTIVIYILLQTMDFSNRLSSVFATIPLWIYATYLFYANLFARNE